MKRVILALPLLALMASPSVAAGKDLIVETLQQRWQGIQEVVSALLMERGMMQNKLSEQQAHIDELTKLCGDRCTPTASNSPSAPPQAQGAGSADKPKAGK